MKKLKSSNRDEDELLSVIAVLANKEPLDEKFRDHSLVGNYAGCRECHIRPDWLFYKGNVYRNSFHSHRNLWTNLFKENGYF
ncbi:MAG: type II toxin-antitoxin system YafQ family toxin [Coraliomargarita sp.]|nr:type II toxin-antitoxin system YafQ family toxin [Coraliomargarita sp.]